MDNLMLIENGLIKVYRTDTGEYVVDGRELWRGLGSKQEFTNWVKKRLKDCDAVENEGYFSFDKKIKRATTGGTTSKEYIIKLDTAKEMAMLERNEIGKQYRRYFIEIEKKYRQGERMQVAADPTKVLLAEAKAINAKTRQANTLLKIAERLPDGQQLRLYQKAAEVLTGEALEMDEDIPPKRPSQGGKYKLTAAEKKELKALAVDGVIPLADYVSKMTEILNRA